MKLAFLLYDEFTLLDLAGPIEVFRHWPGAESHYVALSRAPVRSDSSVTITPTATTESLLDPDVIVVPGTVRPDVFDIDDPARPAHTRLLAKGILIVENLCNLDRLPATGFRFGHPTPHRRRSVLPRPRLRRDAARGVTERPRHLMEPDPDLPDWKLPSLRSVLWTIAGILFLVVVLANYPSLED